MVSSMTSLLESLRKLKDEETEPGSITLSHLGVQSERAAGRVPPKAELGAELGATGSEPRQLASALIDPFSGAVYAQVPDAQNPAQWISWISI